MTDQDYIRKAVELANGWGFDGIWLCYGDAGAKIHDAEHAFDKPMPDYIKDALAAQLVRQHHTATRGRFSRHPYMDDPIDTIKFIVDSGVLDKCPPHDLIGRSDGTAKCADCGELADVTETGAAR